MSRCGCGAGACSCINTAGPGHRVTGNGSIGTPYVHSARLSNDAGNGLRFGSDGGLFAPVDDDTAADICGVSVNNLPTDRLVFGRGGCGRLLGPDHTITSLQRAVDLGVDGSHLHVRELGDGTPVVYPATAMANQTGLAGLTLNDVTAGGYANVPIRAGWNASLPSPQASLGGRHGFFGFGEHDQVGGVTLAEAFEKVGRRLVMLLQMIPPYSSTFPQRVLDMIFRYCVHESTIVGTRVLDDLDLFVNAGIPGCLFLDLVSQADEAPPAQVVSRGVEWVAARLGTPGPTDTQILGYATAGLNVVGFMASRHHQWTQLDAVGARGCISDDALYMTMDPARYRSRTMAETLTHSQVQPGLLAYWTDPHLELPSGPGQPGEVYWPHQARGFYYPPDWPGIVQAFYMPGRMDTPTVDQPSGIPYRTPSGTFDVNIGFFCPVPDPENYVLEAEVSFRDTPTTNRSAGFILCMPDDRSFEERFAAQDPYWVAGISWSGQVFVERWANGALAVDNRVQGTQLVEDEFYRVRVTVTPSAISMARLSPTGTVLNEATVTDPTLRGPYLAWYKKETTPTNVWDPFATAWRNMVMTGPGINAAAARVPMSAPADPEDRNAANP